MTEIRALNSFKISEQKIAKNKNKLWKKKKNRIHSNISQDFFIFFFLQYFIVYYFLTSKNKKNIKAKFCELEIKNQGSNLRKKNRLQVLKHKMIKKGIAIA
jgi:hypothetical protein